MSSGKLERLMLATDFSPHADRALEWAIALARRFGASLELVSSVHVVPFASGPNVFAPPADFLRGVRDATDQRLSELARELAARGVPTSYTVLLEDPSSGICALAREKAIDLLALGTRGRTGLAHVVLGSVAERTARLAPCPVLTLHSDVSPPQPLRKLLVASDFSEPARAALALARKLVEPGGQLVLAHAIPAIMAPGDTPLPDPRSESWARAEYEKWKPTLDGVGSELDLRYGAPDTVLIDAAVRHGADAIVMGTQGRTGLAHMFLGSIAEKVIRRAPLPVFSAKTP
ncbi:MAG TPA: universal stress protein [Myxococcota bacterium]|nr:universal stress protein [Myxococcota bacterium]